MQYFMKVSWQDPNQPLLRIHENIDIELVLDKSPSAWELVDYVKRDSHWQDAIAAFTIDFMCPMP